MSNRQILEINPMYSHSYGLSSDKERVKFIKRTEKIIRSSMEYKDFTQFLKDNWDFTKDVFWKNVDSEISRKIHIEIHHTPLTLYDITSSVLDRHIYEEDDINPLLIAEEVMKCHYVNMVGLAPLSRTIHTIIHKQDDIMVPLQLTSGNWLGFLSKYEEFLSEDIKNKVDRFESFSESFDIHTFDIFRFNPIDYSDELPSNYMYRE